MLGRSASFCSQLLGLDVKGGYVHAPVYVGYVFVPPEVSGIKIVGWVKGKHHRKRRYSAALRSTRFKLWVHFLTRGNDVFTMPGLVHIHIASTTGCSTYPNQDFNRVVALVSCLALMAAQPCHVLVIHPSHSCLTAAIHQAASFFGETFRRTAGADSTSHLTAFLGWKYFSWQKASASSRTSSCGRVLDPPPSVKFLIKIGATLGYVGQIIALAPIGWLPVLQPSRKESPVH